MLNVGKALLRTRGFTGSLETAHHGMQDLSAGAAIPEHVTLKVNGASIQHPASFAS
jgi:hypothetical protein